MDVPKSSIAAETPPPLHQMTLRMFLEAETMRRMITTAASLIPTMIVRSTLSIAALRIDAIAIGALFRETRALSSRIGINGAILSDGERVAHILHGTPDSVVSVLGLITADQRLTDLTVLVEHEADDDGIVWPLSGWKAGWATPEVLHEMTSSAAADPARAVLLCLGLLARCDLL